MSNNAAAKDGNNKKFSKFVDEDEIDDDYSYMSADQDQEPPI